MQLLQNYITNLNRLFQTGNAREHSYRGDLQELLNQIINDDEIIVTNEPARIRDVGAPDYSITKKDIPLGYIEAKDINKPLDSKEYKAALANIQLATGKNGIDALLAKHNVQVLVAPSGPVPGRVDPINGDVWPSWAGAGNLAAVAGYPHLSVPMGAIHGLPIGLSFMAGKNQDAKVLTYGYAYEQHTHKRVEPQYLTTSEDRPEIKKAMARK